MAGKHWRIDGFDGTQKIFSCVVSIALGDAEIKSLLKRLASKHLACDEIVGASLRRNMKGYRANLEVKAIGEKRHGWMTDGNPHYVASVRESSIA